MKRHAFDPLSFISGLVFTALGVAAAAGVLTSLDRVRVAWPLVLVLFGMMLVASTVTRTPAAGTSATAVAGAGATSTALGADPATGGLDLTGSAPSEEELWEQSAEAQMADGERARDRDD